MINVLLAGVIGFIAAWAIQNWFIFASDRNAIGQVHDRLDELFGMKCGNCQGWPGPGILKIEKTHECTCTDNHPESRIVDRQKA